MQTFRKLPITRPNSSAIKASSMDGREGQAGRPVLHNWCSASAAAPRKDRAASGKCKRSGSCRSPDRTAARLRLLAWTVGKGRPGGLSYITGAVRARPHHGKIARPAVNANVQEAADHQTEQQRD